MDKNEWFEAVQEIRGKVHAIGQKIDSTDNVEDLMILRESLLNHLNELQIYERMNATN